MDIATRVHAILAEQAMGPPTDIHPDQSLSDLGIDSLGLVETIFAIEETFDVTTVASVIAAVERLVAARP